MRNKTIQSLIICLCLLGLNVSAADWDDRWSYDQNTEDKFNAPDFSVDLFGTWSDQNRLGEDDESFGGGFGLSFYPVRYFGIMADTYIEEWRVPYRANGSLVFKLPVGQSGLAPYAFGGGGRQWKYIPQWTAHGGAGLEFRMNPYTGIFADWRRVFPEATDDHNLVRFGLHVGF